MQFSMYVLILEDDKQKWEKILKNLKNISEDEGNNL